MASLAEIVKNEVFWYAGGGRNLKTFKLADDTEHVYAVNIVDTPLRTQPASVIVIARIMGDYVVIEEDLTDRPLVDRLIAAGIPREKIVLAYAGERVPDLQQG